MNIVEYFESLTHVERVRVQFFPPTTTDECTHEELRALQNLQRQWEGMLNGHRPDAPNHSSEPAHEALTKFLGRKI